VIRVETDKQRVPTFRKSATVMSNDRAQPQATIWLSGQIRFVVQFEPQTVRLAGLAGTPLTADVTLSPGTELGIEVKGGKAQKDQCVVTGFEPAADGKSYVVHLSAPAAEISGVTRDMVEVEVTTTDGALHKAQIPVVIEHQDRIQMQPAGNVVFQRAETIRLKTPGAAPVRRDVHFFTTQPESRFQVLSVELVPTPDMPEGVFSTELKTVQEGQRYVVSVLVNQYRTEPSVRGTLKVITDDPKKPEREIRLYAQFGEVPTAGQPVPPGQQKPRLQPAPAGKGENTLSGAGKGGDPSSRQPSPAKPLPSPSGEKPPVKPATPPGRS